MARDIWKQLPKEDARQFAAFAVYRDMEMSNRTIRMACTDFHGSDFTENDYRRWTTYAGKHQWKNRARAWDQYRDDQSCEAEIEARREMRVEQVQRARRLQRMADLSIERELEEMEREPTKTLNPALILQFATQGAAMERTCRGEPTAIEDATSKRDPIKIEWGAPNDGKRGVDDTPSTAPSGADGSDRQPG